MNAQAHALPKNSEKNDTFSAVFFFVASWLYFTISYSTTLGLILILSSTFAVLAIASKEKIKAIQLFGFKFKLTRLLVVLLAIGFIIHSYQPAHAFVFVNLENGIKSVITQFSASGASAGITQAIGTFFLALRILIVILIVGGLVGAAVQGFQGGNPQPILLALGLGIVVILMIEGITRLVIPTP